MRLINTDNLKARRAVIAALLREHGVGGRLRPVRRVARAMGGRVSTADVLDVQADNDDAIDRSGNSLTLTEEGLAEAREHPSPRYLET